MLVTDTQDLSVSSTEVDTQLRQHTKKKRIQKCHNDDWDGYLFCCPFIPLEMWKCDTSQSQGNDAKLNFYVKVILTISHISFNTEDNKVFPVKHLSLAVSVQQTLLKGWLVCLVYLLTFVHIYEERDEMTS